MSDNELIALFKQTGQVPRQPDSFHDAENKALNCNHPQGWRVIVCNSEEDVCECPVCGAQRLKKCGSDEDCQ